MNLSLSLQKAKAMKGLDDYDVAKALGRSVATVRRLKSESGWHSRTIQNVSYAFGMTVIEFIELGLNNEG